MSHQPNTTDPNSTDAQEWEVLRPLAHGKENREIAAALHLSVDGVKSRLKFAFARNGFRNRVQAARWVWEQEQPPAEHR